MLAINDLNWLVLITIQSALALKNSLDSLKGCRAIQASGVITLPHELAHVDNNSIGSGSKEQLRFTEKVQSNSGDLNNYSGSQLALNLLNC